MPYVVNFYEGFTACDDLKVYEPLSDIYKKWIAENPFDSGHGWATEPSSQVEMPLGDDLVNKARENADTAIVFISRLAGEGPSVMISVRPATRSRNLRQPLTELSLQGAALL